MTLMVLVGDWIFETSGFGGWKGGMRCGFVMESVSLQLGIPYSSGCTSWTPICYAFCFLSSRNQSTGDKFHYSTFFEFSQGLLSIQLLVLALFCYFKYLLVFPRWFFPWCQKMWIRTCWGCSVYLDMWCTVEFIFFI